MPRDVSLSVSKCWNSNLRFTKLMPWCTLGPVAQDTVSGAVQLLVINHYHDRVPVLSARHCRAQIECPIL